MIVPAGTSVQPIDAGEVAGRLVELATTAPAGRMPDMGGPQVRSAQDLARAYLRASGRHRLVLPVRLPGAVFRGYRQSGHLAPERAVGRVTFEQFLARAHPPKPLPCRTDLEEAMTMRAWPWLRAALLLLTLSQVVVGTWQLLLPRSFYELYWVQLLPPYNEHLLRDVGGLNLALAVVLGASALIMERRLVSTALLAYLMFSGYHLVFHVTHLEHFPQADAIAQTSALALGVAFPLVLLILAWRAGIPHGSNKALPQ